MLVFKRGGVIRDRLIRCVIMFPCFGFGLDFPLLSLFGFDLRMTKALPPANGYPRLFRSNFFVLPLYAVCSREKSNQSTLFFRVALGCNFFLRCYLYGYYFYVVFQGFLWLFWILSCVCDWLFLFPCVFCWKSLVLIAFVFVVTPWRTNTRHVLIT